MKAIPFEPGAKHNHWELLREVPSDKAHRKAEARCVCGVVKIIDLASVRSGQSRSCGQCRRSMLSRKHGGWRSSEYTIWGSIKQRCHNPKNTSYFRYGARGIKVCKRWRKSFSAFLADVGPRPSKQHSLDRFPDNNGDYEPSNVRWATIKQQSANKRADVWKRIVVVLSKKEWPTVVQMVKAGVADAKIARHIARVYYPKQEKAA